MNIIEPLFLGALHASVINPLEKIIYQLYFKTGLRPSCTEYTGFDCLGMPSGHAETATIVCLLLYKKRQISIETCTLIITLVCLQRIIFKRHTIEQVIIGISTGMIYFQLYIKLKPLYFCIVPILILLIVHKLNVLLDEKIPDWVDKSMYKSIEKKKNVPLLIKMSTVVGSLIYRNVKLFMSWKEMEQYLDTIIQNLPKDIKFDAVVGLKTGGAIISDYISKKLNIKNYKIKLTNEDYNCNKKPENFINDFIKDTKGVYKKYTVCEGIEEDITGKNIICIDELLSSGNTMNEAIKYLSSANYIYDVVVCNINDNYKGHYVTNTNFLVYPWGYDN